MTARFNFIAAGSFAFLAIAAGAFGAHALKQRLDTNSLAIWNTAAQYQFYHALALLVLGLLQSSGKPHRLLRVVTKCFGLGIIIFSGSLYALSLSGIKWLGAITPIGGLLFLVGWGVFVIWAAKHGES